MKYKIIAVVGKSGSGKDTFLEIMEEESFDVNRIIATTTRPKRDKEINGENYWFIKEEEFFDKLKDNKFFTNSAFRNWHYGSEYEDLSTTAVNVGIFTPIDIEKLRKNENIDLFVVEIIASDKVRLLRSLNREENPDVKEIIRRYNADDIDFYNFQADYTIINDTWHDYYNMGIKIDNMWAAWRKAHLDKIN